MKEHAIKCFRGFMVRLNNEWIEYKLNPSPRKALQIESILKTVCKDLHIGIELK